ncbi:MAG: hypothetical protein QM607_08300, partial [Microbacterium sp.]
STLGPVRWNRFFEDLEDQLAAEWEAERAALDSEAERVRVARLTLRERLVSLAAGDGASVVVELADGSTLDAAAGDVGADWMSLRTGAGDVVLVPLAAIRSIAAAHEQLLRSARPVGAESRLAQRVTFGFALRDLARRRVSITLGLSSGRALTGTIDRVGADHLDLAQHDLSSPRRSSEVTAFRILHFEAVCWVRVDASMRGSAIEL